MTDVTPEELAARLRDGEALSVLDLRDRDVFERWGIDGRGVTSRQVPHVRFVASHATGDVRDPLPDLPEPMLVVCGRGEASAQVAGWLRDVGVDARNLAGGTEAWATTILAADLVGGGRADGDRAGDDRADGDRAGGGRADGNRADGDRTGDDRAGGDRTAGDVTIRQYHRPATGCLSYLVASDGEAILIDPLRAATDRYLADCDALGVSLTAVLDTHVHADHVSGLHALGDRTAATTILPDGTRDRDPAFEPDRFLADGEEITVGDATLTAIAAPGHTRESIALHGSGHLFAGDALFLRSVGRPDLVGGDDPRELASAAYETLHDRLLALPDETILAPGHTADPADARDGVYAAPLAGVRELDVLGLDRAAFLDRVTSRLPPKPANYEQIVAANLGRETLDDETAFDAELGPNHCAVSGD